MPENKDLMKTAKCSECEKEIDIEVLEKIGGPDVIQVFTYEDGGKDFNLRRNVVCKDHRSFR